jgi:heme oxygenase
VTIIQKLKTNTSACHKAIEENALLKKLMGKQITLSEYISILKKFYGFYLPFEDSLDWGEIESLTEMRLTANRRKTTLLEKDLLYFNIPLDQILISPVYPHSHTFPALMGCFYVLEGSCLGRRMMWPRLANTLGLGENQGGVFFLDCGDELPETWKCFCSLLTSKIKTDADEQECINAAIQTFEDIDKWFKAP